MTKPMDQAFLDDFKRTLDEARSRLLARSDAEAGQPRSPGKWSPKEIVGHLIDSAANNHARFVRAQAQDDLVFEGYDQDAWVRAQRYAERPWTDLVHLWHAYNHHLASVMAAADAAAINRPRQRHNLDVLAWKPLDRNAPATLDYFMRDYVGHMKHHLRQILG
jgi:hypothetical protein